MLEPRPYQKAAIDAAISWMRKCTDPAVLELATGAGKSIIAAFIATWLNQQTNKKILVLQPSKELTEQNKDKFLALGEPCSVWCASIGKSLTHDVVFGTPKSVVNSIDKFKGRFAAIIIDECHRIDATTRNVVHELRSGYKNLRVIGMTATPYRIDMGYIFKFFDGERVHSTLDPYFHTLIHRVTARKLIAQGFLTPPVAERHAGYDTINVKGVQKDLDRAVEGQNRKTSAIVREIVELSQNRKGVMIFASTIKHANEVMQSLPPHLSECVTGKTAKQERENILNRFKSGKVKYLVNVAVLTTGFDAPHVDVVAVLRATESVSLLQQIVGRGLRLFEGKNDVLVLDYAENIDRHCPDGDLFNPEIKAPNKKGESKPIPVQCPVCGYENQFNARKNDEGFEISEDGYFVDLAGSKTEMPAHYGRRCEGERIVSGRHERCAHRWEGKDCPECGHHNDIAARACEECNEELVDPNEKLRLDFTKMKKDPYQMTTDKVLSWEAKEHFSAAGNQTLKVTYKTEYRTFSVWYMPKKHRDWNDLSIAVFGRIAPTVEKFMGALTSGYGEIPKTVTVKRNQHSKFYQVYGHNRPEDVCP